MKMIKVSVVIPVYNNEKYLERCIRSVINQSLKEIEIIVVDDGSTDSAPAIMDKLSEEDDRINVIHKENEGYSAAVNKGIDLAKGEYIAIVESDDYCADNMYEELYARAKNTDADVVKCGFYFHEEETEDREYRQFYYITNEEDVFTVSDYPVIFRYHASVWAGIYKRDFLNQYHLRFLLTPKASYSDYSWMTMTYAYAKKISIVHRPLYFYAFDNPDSSHFCYGERYKYKFYHSMESNRILREAGVFNDVREYIAIQSFWNNVNVAKYIKKEDRLDCFKRLQEFCNDMFDTTFEYANFGNKGKYIIQLICDGKIEEFYKLIFFEYIIWDIESLVGKKVVLFGAGKCGTSFRYQLQNWKIEIVKWIDNYANFDEEIERPESIDKANYDCILLAVVDKQIADAMKKQLLEIGVSESKIVWKLPLEVK